MTDFAHSVSSSVITSVVRHIGNTLAVYRDSLRAATRAHDAYENYGMMTDAALFDLGLKREEIAAHVMKRYLASGS